MVRRVLLALPIMLGGCATYYPPLYSAPSMVANAPAGSDTLIAECKTNAVPIKQTISCAEILQAIYSNSYAKSAKWQDISQLPIIGAAAAAAWILLKDEGNAARKAGKIGIGALTYTAARNQLMPKDMSVAFIKGHGALGCVLAQGEFFSGTRAVAHAAELEKVLAEAFQLRIDVQELRYIDPVDGKKTATPEMLAAARTLADQSISLSGTQLESSQAQLGAYQFANAAFRKAVTDIASWVASRGRATRPNETYDTILGTFKQTPQPETTQLERTDVPKLIGSELVKQLATKSGLLANATIRLKGATPDYKARLDSVAKCASDLSSST